jgi:hypothetical protein
MSVLRNFSGLAVCVSAALLGSACSSNTGPGSAAITSAQADTVSQVIVNDAQSEVDYSAAIGSAVYLPGAAPASVGCVSRTPASPANSDGDPVPDSVRLTFTDCIVNYPLSSDTVRGAIDILDPTPVLTDHAWKHIFTNLSRIHVGPLGRESSITLNGARQIVGDSAQLTFTSTNVETDFQWPNGAMASHIRSWTLAFTADTAGHIVFDGQLPNGSLSVSGTSTWTRGPNTWQIDASTPAPLHYDASCTVRPKFDSGTFKAVVTRNNLTTNVMIQFTACGTFTVTRS